MDLFEEFLEKEAERLRTCWAAFLALLRTQILPLPPRYAEEFARAEKLSPEEKKNLLKRITSGRGLYIVAFLDLCDFKEINDRFGHQIGDRLLVQAARRLRAFTKRVDVPVRLGGDEFCLFLAAPSVEKAEPFLRDLTAAPISLSIKGEEARLYFACGATDVLGDDSLESCLHRADLAMYKHKTLLKEWLSSGAKGPPPRPVLFRAFSRDL